MNTQEINALELQDSIKKSIKYLIDQQQPDGHWVFELEADVTISAEYILLMHFVDEIDEELQEKIAVYIRSLQNEDGSYSLFTDGPSDLSATVKAYYALRLAKDWTAEEHMIRAREYILANGGASQCNVFTRITLAMFGQVPWRAVPYMPVEIVMLPKWFPFHMDKMAYWSRVVMIPLLMLYSLKAKAVNPHGIDIRELFLKDPNKTTDYFNHVTTISGKIIHWLDRIMLSLDWLRPSRGKAFGKAFEWMLERMNGEDGLGAIFPAMANAYMLLHWIGCKDTPVGVTAKKALEKLLVVKEDFAYCQPCVSPVWDTSLTGMAFKEVMLSELAQVNSYETDYYDCSNSYTDLYFDEVRQSLDDACCWLSSHQLIHDPDGDWKINRPNLGGGGWAFQYNNPYYPDVDDTAVAAIVIDGGSMGRSRMLRALEWIIGMQSSNGGWGAFDVDNNKEYLNHIPFADHGALLDPPSADVTARCLMLFDSIYAHGSPPFHLVRQMKKARDRGLEFIREQQESDGSWFGRWGTNYIYGTWSVLMGVERLLGSKDPMVASAVAWLKSVQNEDGGWGEDNYTYHDSEESKRGRFKESTAFHTALGVLALCAAGQTGSDSVRKGVSYLISTQNNEGYWDDRHFNAPGFPKVFYLKYHGYSKFFPLWALAKYYFKRTPMVDNENSSNMERDLKDSVIIRDKVRNDDDYAQRLYAMLCNNVFQPTSVFEILKDAQWGCSWRYAGGVIADIRCEGDYMDWYCSGSEGKIYEDIDEDLKSIGWRVIPNYYNSEEE